MEIKIETQGFSTTAEGTVESKKDHTIDDLIQLIINRLYDGKYEEWDIVLLQILLENRDISRF